MRYFSLLQVKCDQYWPTRGTETYGLIQVTLLDTVELATYCVRTFALFKVSISVVCCVVAL